jgi:hypothetical protein
MSTVKSERVVKEGVQIQPYYQASLLQLYIFLFLTQLNSLTNYFSKSKYGLTCCCFHVPLCSGSLIYTIGHYLHYYFSLKRKIQTLL